MSGSVSVDVDGVVVKGARRLRGDALRLLVERAVARELGEISSVSARAPAVAGVVAERVSNAIAGGERRG